MEEKVSILLSREEVRSELFVDPKGGHFGWNVRSRERMAQDEAEETDSDLAVVLEI